jgi:hypothetical protein
MHHHNDVERAGRYRGVESMSFSRRASIYLSHYRHPTQELIGRKLCIYGLVRRIPSVSAFLTRSASDFEAIFFMICPR